MLEGRVAIITGASSGIGRETARELSKAGMRLLVTARREERLRELSEELNEAEWMSGDLTDTTFPERLLARTVQRFGRCDVLVNNAGIMVTGTVDELKAEKISAMVRTNIEGPFLLAYAAIRHFKAQGSGHLVNISSVLGTKTRPTAGVYAGTKAAIEMLSEALRLELVGTGVRVTSLQPGLVMTELHREFPVHPKELFHIQSPLQPCDIARGVRWVLEQPAHVNVARIMILPQESPL